MRFVWAGLLAIWLVAPGCRPVPKAVSLAELADQAHAESLAGEYWAVSGLEPVDRDRLRRVVFTGFEVEFMTAKREYPFRSQPVLGLPPITPISLGLELTGLGRQQVRFTESLEQSVADRLRDELVRIFAVENIEVIFGVPVRATESYAKFETAEIEQTGAFQQVNFVSTDTGQVRSAEVRPASGFALILGTTTDQTVAEVSRELVDELDADLAMSVRIRAGVYRGLATLERGSRVDLVGRRDVQGRVESLRSLLSEEKVLADSAFRAVRGSVLEIDESTYIEEIERMLPIYLDLMFRVMRGPEPEQSGADGQPDG